MSDFRREKRTTLHFQHLRKGAPLAAVAALLSAPAAATTTLTVDLSTSIGPAKHVASGSLYGVTETKPADVTGLIAPLKPNVFINPAAAGSGLQQPVGDAIVAAGRVAPTGGRVIARLADWFPGWPYNFTTMTDWLSKVDTTVSRRKSAGLTNIHAYEIWNEPDGTWAGADPAATGTRPVSFNQLWLQTFQHLRQVDPTIKITGPSISYFNSNFIKSFLTFCKTNNCLPDIVGWHELSGGNLTGNYTSYRAIEQQLGIGPIPISINEYSGKGDLTDEGKPGTSAPMIAKFERFQYDSACISYWDVAHAGRLGSLLATDTAKNGGWWFYKWYGDMSGTMVSTTPPSPNDSAALDGFANLDTAGSSASVLFGGVSDGTIQVVIKGLQAATFFGSKVHAVVEHTPFVNRTTVVNATDTVSSADLTVSNNQVSVTVAAANSTDGYRVLLTPVGGAGGATSTGGTTALGGTSTTGGTRAAGGTSTSSTGGSPSGGSTASAGSAATGGAMATGGSKASGGTSALSNTGGVAATTGGKAASGGISAVTGGTLATVGGATNNAVGGQLGLGGANATGGAAAAVGGFVGTAGTPTNSNSDAGVVVSTEGSSQSGGCGCRVGDAHSTSRGLALFGLLGAIMLPALRRRRA